MGKMIMNDANFSSKPNNNGLIVPQTTALSSGMESLMTHSNNYSGLTASKGLDLTVRYDMISNIVGDACGVINNIINAITAVNIEREKTKQVKATAKAQIKVAKEQTEQVRLHEESETERFGMECETRLEEARIGLEKELALIEKDKESILSDERKFMMMIKSIQDIISGIIKQNEILIREDIHSEAIIENNKKLMNLAETVTRLYIHETS